MPIGGGFIVIEIENSVKMSSTSNQTCNIAVLDTDLNLLQSSTSTITVVSSSNSTVPNVLTIKFLQNFTYSSPNLLQITLPLSLSIRNAATTKPWSMKASSYDAQSTPNLIDEGIVYTTPFVL
jgi:hypothetical protein